MLKSDTNFTLSQLPIFSENLKINKNYLLVISNVEEF